MFNFEKFCDDYEIQYWDSGKNVTPGWLNVCCPFCDDSSNHLGYNISKGYFKCWKCGFHKNFETIKLLSQESNEIIRELILKYDEYSQRKLLKIKHDQYVKKQGSLVLPVGFKAMKTQHYEYLQNRNFDPIYLEKKYNLLGTDYSGDYKFRIIAPIYFEGNLVSYQGRDITGKQELRYKACKKENEIIHHKDILYNLDNCKEDWVIICEGIFDVWRIGDNCCGTFGTGFTNSQLNIISKRFKKVFILFDNEPEAFKNANNMINMLEFVNSIECGIIKLPEGFKDPGELDQESVREILKEVGKKL